jgi:NAD(P)-dependent dehydrogenase (short-subunit alcohol dehydrogenase family)
MTAVTPLNLFKLDGKTALITGASGGLGEVFAHTLAAAGADVTEAAVVMEPASGAIVHAFTSGTMVQIFQLEPHGVSTHVSAGTSDDVATSG